MDDDLDTKSFVLRSEYRRTVMRRLAAAGPLMPSSIADQTEIHQPHVSRALSELNEKGLVTLAVSESQRKGRLYELTEQGEAIWAELHPVNWQGPLEAIPDAHREVVTYLQHELGDDLMVVGHYDGSDINNYYIRDRERIDFSEEELGNTAETLVEDFSRVETHAGGIAGDLVYEAQSFTGFHRILIYTDGGFLAVGLDPKCQFTYPVLMEECREVLRENA